MFTGEMLAKWAEMALAVGAKYWYGTCWYDAEESLLSRKAKQYPKHYTADRMSTYKKHIAEKRMVCDCVGLIKGFFWTGNGQHANRYKANNCPDTSADGMIRLCEETGVLANMPDERGLVVWSSGHIGVYVGNGEVIEARGYRYGVVRTRLNARGWKKWGRLPAAMLNYDEPAPEAKPDVQDVGKLGHRLLKRGSEGEDVRTLQQLLAELGYDLGSHSDDGDFGADTEGAVKNFQADHGLEVDGKYGPLSHAELMGVMAENELQENESDDEEKIIGRVLVTGNTVNIRTGPGTGYVPLTIVRRGDSLDLVATAANGWHAVRLNDGRSGWIGPTYSRVEAA